MRKKIMLLVSFMSIPLLAEGYSTNMTVKRDSQEIFEDVQIKAIAGISEYPLKHEYQETENAIDFSIKNRMWYVSAEYSQLQKNTKKRERVLGYFDDKNIDYFQGQLFYRPKDEDYIIGYEYKGVEKIRDLHSLILGYAGKNNYFFVNPYVEEDKTGIAMYDNNGEKKKKTQGGVNLQTYLKMPVPFSDSFYATVDFNFKGSKSKELGLGFYMPYTLQITDSSSIDLNVNVKYYKEVSNEGEKEKRENKRQRFIIKMEPTYHLTENIFIKTEIGYVATKYEEAKTKDDFSVGVGIGFTF